MDSSSLRSLIDLFYQINLLKSLPRTGWLLAGVAQAESVAEHTGCVALFAMFLAKAINQDPAAHGLGQPLDMEQVLVIALLHDLPEVIVTDLPKRATSLLGKDVKHRAEQSALAQLLAAFPDQNDWLAGWTAYEQESTPEARLVKDVDKLEMVVQARRYEARGHRNLAEFQQGHRWHYSICREIVADLIQADAPSHPVHDVGQE